MLGILMLRFKLAFAEGWKNWWYLAVASVSNNKISMNFR